MGDQIRIPRVVIIWFFFSLFFPSFFQGDIKACRTAILCPSFRHGRIFVYLFDYRIHKQRDTLFELSSILWTVDLSKHLITSWIFPKFIQLDNFVTFSVFFFFFGNRVWLNLYEQIERALSCFREMRTKLLGTSVYTNVHARIYSMHSISAIRHWVLESKFEQ